MSAPNDRILLPNHQALLDASAIAPEVATARGYFTATKRSELEALGFAIGQRRAPGLVLPVHDAHGRIAVYQLRPDQPRAVKGKPLKYETPRGARMVLDVPPCVRERLSNPNVPLFITEGIRKADSAASQGLCCIALLGVWNWIGTNANSGKTALADWREIALNDRLVFLGFDSDVVTKAEVAKALAELTEYLTSRSAQVRICKLAPGPGGEKTGLDDFFFRGGTVEQLLETARPAGEMLNKIAHELASDRLAYRMERGRSIWSRPVQGGAVDVVLANFEARITREIMLDDGSEQSISLEIESVIEGGAQPPIATVTAEKFAGMSWIVPAWGTRAIVSPGPSMRDHLRAAIQRCSTDVTREIRYAHTGWRRIDDRDVYLHGGGAIGENGVVDGITVELARDLSNYVLPAPPDGDKLRQALRSSLGLLDVGPDRVTAPLLGAVYRALLGPSDFSVHVTGATGVFKTELSTLALRHFGSSFSSRRPPASWASTANALERLAHAAADALLLVDDFAPGGSLADVARLHREADRLLRAQGNLAGRARMRADGSLRPTRAPRGLILSTGEDVPRGQSLRARTLVLELEHGDIDAAKLSGAQAASAMYSAALAGVIRWLAPRLEEQRAELRDSIVSWRGRSAAHARTPELLAQLMVGVNMVVKFSVESKSITATEAEALRQRAEQALREVGAAQAEQIRSVDPARRFVELLAASLVSGEAHLADAVSGDAPDTAPRWGWRSTMDKSAPLGRRIGWVNGCDLFLEPEATFAVVQRLGSTQGEALGVGLRSLWRRLQRSGFLVSAEAGRSTVRRLLAGSMRRVLHLHAEALSSAYIGQSGHTGQSKAEARGNGSGGLGDARSNARSEPAPEDVGHDIGHREPAAGAAQADCPQCPDYPIHGGEGPSEAADIKGSI